MRITHTFTNEIEFNNALDSLSNIVESYYDDEQNAGYIVTKTFSEVEINE